MAKSSAPTLTQLGQPTELPASPDEARLETVPNPHRDASYVVRFTCPEFTSLCPVTGQPDFAHLVIDYVPKDRLVESKSLKLFLGAFRNHGSFHEDCTLTIARRLEAALEPVWLRIGGYWYPRGGIPIDVFARPARPPRACGCPIKACRPIGRRAEDSHPDTRIVARGRTADLARARYTVHARGAWAGKSGQGPLCTLECAAGALNSSRSWSSGTPSRSTVGDPE